MASQPEIRSFFKKRSSSDAAQSTETEVAPSTDAGDGCSSTEKVSLKKMKTSSREKNEEERIMEIKGDLFSCPKSFSLAHCVSEDLRLGKGIAKLFRDRYGGIDGMRRQNVNVGGVAVIPRTGGGGFVYNLVTKEKYWQKPTYDSLRRSLESMVAHMKANDVNELAMPRIGCGLDGLQWSAVRKVIDEVFNDKNGVKVRIYSI